MPYLILTFNSTHHALHAEKLLLGAGIPHEIIPTPKDISSDCGISIRLSPASDVQKISSLLLINEIQCSITERK